MIEFKINLSEQTKGILFVIVGIILALHGFGFFQQWLNTIAVIAGIGMVIYGFLKLDGVHKVKKMFKALKDNK